MTTLRNPYAYRASLLLAVFAATLSIARADDLTGLPVDDPKDLLPTPVAPPQTACQSGGQFVPMPAWARGVTLGPLPDKLLPMGRNPKVAAAPKPQPLAPPADTTNSNEATTANNPTSTPGPKPSSDPAFIAVSPFLQWIKANPQAAAAQARQQAQAYHAAAPAPENATPGAPAAPAHNPQDDAYWLPPLIDSADFGPTPVVTGSAAIYTRPQR